MSLQQLLDRLARELPPKLVGHIVRLAHVPKYRVKVRHGLQRSVGLKKKLAEHAMRFDVLGIDLDRALIGFLGALLLVGMVVQIPQPHPQKRPLGLRVDQLLKMGFAIRRVTEDFLVEGRDTPKDERHILYPGHFRYRHRSDGQERCRWKFPRAAGVTLSAPKIPGESHGAVDGIPLGRLGDRRVEDHRADVVSPRRAARAANER